MIGVIINGKAYSAIKNDITVVYLDDKEKNESIKTLKGIPKGKGCKHSRTRIVKKGQLTRKQIRKISNGKIAKAWNDYMKKVYEYQLYLKGKKK